MTKPQRIMLFSLFSRAMTASGIVGSVAREEERERLTVQVCGEAKSWSAFDNADVDRMKGVLLAITKPADLDAQLTQLDMPRTRLLFAIRKAADAAYVAKIAFDRFSVRDIGQLDDAQLEQLRNTLHSRRGKPAKCKPAVREEAAYVPVQVEDVEVPF